MHILEGIAPGEVFGRESDSLEGRGEFVRKLNAEILLGIVVGINQFQFTGRGDDRGPLNQQREQRHKENYIENLAGSFDIGDYRLCGKNNRNGATQSNPGY